MLVRLDYNIILSSLLNETEDDIYGFVVDGKMFLHATWILRNNQANSDWGISYYLQTSYHILHRLNNNPDNYIILKYWTLCFKKQAGENEKKVLIFSMERLWRL